MKRRHLTRCMPFRGSWGWEAQFGGMVVLWKCWGLKMFWDPFWRYVGNRR